MYDLIIIGGGPGGYHMAIQAQGAGLKTAVVEGNKFGGVCLNVGCIPSKAFIHFSNIANETNHSLNEGIVGNEVKVDQNYVVDYKDQKVDFLVKGTEMQVKASGATIINGWAKILPKENDEFKVEVNGEVITSKFLTVATGSVPAVPGFIKGAQENYTKGDTASPILTSDEILSLREVPEKLVVVGAGVIGLELGSHFASIGSEVTLIDVAEKIAGPFDTDVSKGFQKALEVKGMKFVLGAKVSEITNDSVSYETKDGEIVTIPHNKVLLSVGRTPNTGTLGLENIEGLEIERGWIKTDLQLRTNVENLFAIGDINGVSQLAHTAYREGEVAVATMVGKTVEMDYDAIPAVIYGTPNLAEIGINEDRAKAEGMDVTVNKLPMMYSGRFVVEVPKYQGELIKVITNNANNQIVGIVMFGSYASEMIGVGTILVGEKFDKERVKNLTFAHPTVHEIIKDAINH